MDEKQIRYIAEQLNQAIDTMETYTSEGSFDAAPVFPAGGMINYTLEATPLTEDEDFVNIICSYKSITTEFCYDESFFDSIDDFIRQVNKKICA